MGRGDLQIASDEAFWHLTLREFHALIRRHRAQSDRQDFRAGLIAASILNTMRAKKEDHFFEPADLFPHLPRYADPEPRPVQILSKFKDILSDIGIRPRPVKVQGKPLLPLTALPSRALIEARLRKVAP